MAAKKNKSKKEKQSTLPKTEQTVAAEVTADMEASVCNKVENVELREPMTRKDIVMVVLYGLLMFTAMSVQTAKMAVALAAIAVVLCIGKKPLANMRAHLSLPTLGMVAFALTCGMAALHSRFGGQGAAELYKAVAAFSLAVILLARFEKKHVRGLLWAFVTICSVLALVCVDMGSWGKIFVVYNGYVNLMGADFSGILQNSLGGRLNGIYNDANLTGSLLGLAIPLSAYLAHTAENQKGRFCGLMALGVSAVSFMAAMSRGAMLMFGISILIYLAAEGGKTRTRLFFLLLTGGLAGVVFGALAMMSLGEGNILPVLLALAAGPAAYALDWAVMARVAKKLEGRGKLVLAVCGVLVAVVVVGVFAAFNITEPHDFANGGLTRGMALKPGTYTVSADWSGEGDVTLKVLSRTREEILLGNEEYDYEGSAQGAAFAVGEHDTWVHFFLRGEEGTILNAVTLSDGTEIPMEYKFLPGEITRRLQDGLLQGANFQQRLQYMRDGMEIFKQSPLIGHGYGASEFLLVTVQPYYYQSLFIHNHIIQIMDEMGILGLAAFLLLMGGVLFVLIRRRMKAEDSLAAVLIACWAMMNLHGLMEISFSVRMFQCAAFFVLTMAALAYEQPMSLRVRKLGGTVVLGVVCLYLAVFGSLLQGHRTVQKEAGQFNAGDVESFMSGVQSFVDRDAFDKAPHQLNYVANALNLDMPEYNEVMHEYVKELHEEGTYQTFTGLAQYYYVELRDWKETFACTRLAIGQIPSNAEVWDQQIDFYRNTVLSKMNASDMPALVEGVEYLEDYLERYSEGRLEEIKLSEKSLTFLQKVHELDASGVSDTEMYQELFELNMELNAG